MLVPVLQKPRRTRRTAARFRLFEYLDTASADLGSAQGVATIDGITFWAAAGTPPLVDPDHAWLYKYTRSGSVYSLVASRDTSGDWPAGMSQINSLHIHNGVLYAGGNNYSTTPAKGWILEFDPDDLSHLATHAVQDHWSEGGAWRPNLSGEEINDEFWACYANAVSTSPDEFAVSRYDAAFSHIDDYSLPVDYDSGSLFHEGLAWKGNLLFAMIHDGTTPILAEVFAWDPVGESFSLVQRLRPPTDECTQGLALAGDGHTMWWAERFHGGSPTQDHRIVHSTLHEVRVPGQTPRVRAKSDQAASLIGWYPLNDNTGATAREIVTGTHDGSLAGGASWLAEPARGPCVAVDGVDGRVALPAALLGSALADVTICGWFLADAIPSPSILISGNATGANAGDWQINIESNLAIRFAYNSTGTTLVTPGYGRRRHSPWRVVSRRSGAQERWRRLRKDLHQWRGSGHQRYNWCARRKQSRNSDWVAVQ